MSGIARWPKLATMALAVMPFAEHATAFDVAVGAQYDTTNVYVAPGDLDTFVSAFTATFGGNASRRAEGNVLPVPSHAALQYVWAPVGTLSVFGFDTAVAFPFGSERSGYLVKDMDRAIDAARGSGAEIIVAPFKDPIGIDAVMQWPGGVRTQLYWHFIAPNYPPLTTIPDNRVYVSPDKADEFVRDFLRFSNGRLVSDDRHADAGEIGCPGELYRRIQIASRFGQMQVLVTNGHLPYPFGRELTGYQVGDLNDTISKAKAAGVEALYSPFDAATRRTAILQFPGGYIAEVHAVKCK